MTYSENKINYITGKWKQNNSVSKTLGFGHKNEIQKDSKHSSMQKRSDNLVSGGDSV